MSGDTTQKGLKVQGRKMEASRKSPEENTKLPNKLILLSAFLYYPRFSSRKWILNRICMGTMYTKVEECEMQRFT